MHALKCDNDTQIIFSHKKRAPRLRLKEELKMHQVGRDVTVPQGCCQWDIIIAVRVCEPCEDDRAHSLLRLLQGLMKNSYRSFERVPTCVRDSRSWILEHRSDL